MIQAVIALGLLFLLLGKQGMIFMGLVLVAAGAAYFIYSSYANGQKASARERIRTEQAQVCIEKITEHVRELERKEQQLVAVGDYGIKDTGAWQREKKKFVDLVIRPALNRDFVLDFDSVSRQIDKAVQQCREQLEPHRRALGITVAPDMPGRDYELLCCHLLRQAGWTAKATPQSGDQGADVIAEMGQLRVVVQCKRYTEPVGNSAVQEVHAAKDFYGADYGAVVTNAGFTPSARLLAQSTGTVLLHHDELGRLEHLVAA